MITSTHPLPAELAIRGLDHLERAFPREAAKLLTCLGDYNNHTGLICRSRVTDDYDGRLFFLSYAAEPSEDAPARDVLGAIINCYIKAESARKAHALATERLARDGWTVTSHREVSPVDLTCLADEAEDSLIRQACIDGCVFHVFTYSQLDEQEEPEEG